MRDTANPGRRTLRGRWRAAGSRQRQTARLAASSAALGLVLASTAVVLSGPWEGGQRTAERQRTAAGAPAAPVRPDAPAPQPEAAPSAPAVLNPLGTTRDRKAGAEEGANPDRVPAPTSAALTDALAPGLKDPALGRVTTVSVVDAVSGRDLFSRDAGRAVTPASTVKIATAAAALSARGPDHRIATRVVRDGGRLVLVGGGDPTLGGEDLKDLARTTAEALERDEDGRTRAVTLAYDLSAYRGPVVHPLGTNPNLAPVTALMLDSGRLDDSTRGPAPRSADPARDAARAFADALEDEDVDVRGAPREGEAGKGAGELAVHRSAPLSSLVERMLTYSDNDLAEALARQTVLADRDSAGFADVGPAVERRLKRLGVPVEGASFADGSGLDRRDKVTAGLLTRLMAVAADPDRPSLRPVLTGLPVAGFTGTLDGRYGGDGTQGAGVVRAKTGTLTGVNSLAGTVVDADGRLLLFALLTEGTTDRNAAQDALDALASTLANCGCR